MVQYIRCTSHQALLLTLLMLVVQCYALFMNTHHVFHGKPPMCQFCATVDKNETGSASTVPVIHETGTIEFIAGYSSHDNPFLVVTRYQSRAPPFLISNAT